MNHAKILFISDTHLGSHSARTDKLIEVLKKAEDIESLETIYLIGDFIDGWKLSRKKFSWKEQENKIIRKLIKFIQNGIKIVYIAGNHDDFMRKYIGIDAIKNLSVLDEDFLNIDGGKKYLIIHGDQFDAFIKHKLSSDWLIYLGDSCYETLIYVSRKYMELFNSKFSISKFIKGKFKNAMKYISSYEDKLMDYADRNGCYGVICGHIHCPKISEDLKYINTGDFVENNSYVWMDGKGNFYLEYI